MLGHSPSVLIIVRFSSMNEVLMWICSMHHLMPYVIHEMTRHPRNEFVDEEGHSNKKRRRRRIARLERRKVQQITV